MTRVFSTYEAKAKFSEIIRKVRGGERVVIAYRGKQVAEIRPIQEQELLNLEDRCRRLEEDGILSRAAEPSGPLAPIARRPGALARFLASRE
jgi:prevent-host-death family protein